MASCSSSCDSAEYQILVCIKNILQSAASGDKTISELLEEIVQAFSDISFEGATIDMNQLTELDVSGIECRIEGTNTNIATAGVIIENINNMLKNIHDATAATYLLALDSQSGNLSGQTPADCVFVRFTNQDDVIVATVNGAALMPSESVEFSIPSPQFTLPTIVYDSGSGGTAGALRVDVLTKGAADIPAIDFPSASWDDLSSCTP